MRALVTGGAGFLGSHLCDALIRRGDEVLCFDDMSTGRAQNVEHLFDHPNFRRLTGDVRLRLAGQFDTIFNLACPASPVAYQRDPLHTLTTSVMGALSVLDLAQRTGAKVLQASTSEVYGDPAEHPQTESYWGNVNPIGLRACYDEGKRAAETLFFDHHRQLGTRIKVARIFNTYGPRMRPDDGRVVSNFITQAMRGEAITIYGDGTQTRSFCYVDDMVDGLLRLMDSAEDVTGPVNLGSTEEVTIFELASRVSDALGGRFGFKPLPEDDPAQRWPDTGLARRLLGWGATTPLREGLERTITHFRATLAEAVA